MTTNDNFCPIPWNHSMLAIDGSYRMCCLAKYPENSLSPQEASFNNDINEYRNTSSIINVRKQMLYGTELPNICEGCIEDEKIGNLSKRQSVNLSYPEMYDKAKKLTQQDGTIDTNDFPITYQDIRFSNECNLKCTICDAFNSNQWGKETQELLGRPVPKYRIDFENSKYFKSLCNINNKVERIYFAGGEPLIHKAHHLYLQYLVDNNKAKNISLEYNTNLLSLNTRVLKLWENFKKVEVFISADGIKDYYDFLRYPGKWSVFLEKMKKLEKFKISHEVMVVVNIYNILHLIDMIEWFKQKNKVFYPRFLFEPTYLDARNVRNKNYIIQLWEECLTNLDSKHKQHYQPILNFLKQDVNYDYNEFLEFNEKLCNYRNLNYKRLFNHL